MDKVSLAVVVVVLAATTMGTEANNNNGGQCRRTDDEDGLDCRMRTLQSGLDEAEVGGLASAKRLTVVCSDLFFTESRLKSEHFGNLPSLQELSIEHCKIRQVPPRSFSGLPGLKKLSLESHNAEWSSVLMEVDPLGLKNLRRVEEISLAHNNIWSLPRGLLCDLSSLRKVNLSNNHLLSVSDAGLSSEVGSVCRTSISSMDLSANHISTLQRGDLRQAEDTLIKLDLSKNKLALLGDRALEGLVALTELNLADNQLAALPPAIFNRSSGRVMERLHLQNNSLTLLPAKIFAGLSGLRHLNLSRNAISSSLLSSEAFSGLERLEELDLSHNQLAKVTSGNFKDLVSLKVVLLGHNAMHTVSGDTFFSQRSTLVTLGLSHNQLARFTEGDFLSGLDKLRSLSLDHNKFESLPGNVFGQTPSLEDLSLDNNRLSSVPRSISDLKVLKTLDLGENLIGDLGDGDLFFGLEHLYGLRLSGNLLESIDKGHFANASNLHVLNLARNRLTHIEQGSFDGLVELRALRLDNNALTDVNGVVSGLSKLQWFNVSSNRLQWFDYAFVPSSLEWLDLHYNQIEELGNYYKLGEGYNIKTLDASQNKIKSLNKLSLPAQSLETVNLSGNEIEDIEPKLFEDKPNLSRVLLKQNSISHLKLSSLFLGESDERKGRDWPLSTL